MKQKTAQCLADISKLLTYLEITTDSRLISH